MTEKFRLAASDLYNPVNVEKLEFSSTADLPDLHETVGQKRAMESLKFGVGIKTQGYNLYVMGPQGLGHKETVSDYLSRQAASEPAPADWCYVNNFSIGNKPKYLRLPAGYGIRFQADIENLISDLRTAIPNAYETAEYQSQANEIEHEYDEQQEKAFASLREKAEKNKINLMRTPGGFAFSPVKDKKVLTPEEYDSLTSEEQDRIEKIVEELQNELREILLNIPKWRRDSNEKLKSLNREIAMATVTVFITEIRQRYAELPEVQVHLQAVANHIVDHAWLFRERDSQLPQFVPEGALPGDSGLRIYEINVLVDNSDCKNAPLVYEDNPSYDSLVGRVEHLTRMGALMTDFTLIRAGALHKANGGYLVIDSRKILSQPYAWEALKRALYSKEIRIESLGQMLSLVSTVTLEPEPIPLDTKIVLVGSQLLYYLLCEYDPEFAELFKVSVDFSEELPRNEENMGLYAQLVAMTARSNQLKHFDKYAVAALIEYSSRNVDDNQRLSAHLGKLKNIMQEADYWANESKHKIITKDDVRLAISRKIYRSDKVRERVHEEILRENILVDTSGSCIGQINGLSIMELGGFRFGRPTKITTTISLGKGEIIDIEREVELGGSIHSKGVLILSHYLRSRYCPTQPFSLVASIVFEQSYGLVEGDSASVAELCAILSAISNIPIKQSIAVTGSVNQSGLVQPIGGVNEKIEGFFSICGARNLTGEQGVVIPVANIKNLMLNEDVIDAVRQNQFHIYAVHHIDEALEILTGQTAGSRDENGDFPESSVNRAVEDRLLELASHLQEFSETSNPTIVRVITDTEKQEEGEPTSS